MGRPLPSHSAMDLSVFFAGTAGSVPTARRGLPALLLRAGGERLLFDCGEGTQQQLLRSVGLPDLHAIFLTHYHLDHWLGLVGMLKTFDLRAREAPLTVYGPPGLDALIGSQRHLIGRLGYPLTLRELDRHDEVRFGDWTIEPFAVDHRTGAFGYAFAEDERPGRSTPRPRDASGSRRAPTSAACRRGRRSRGSRPSGSSGPPRPGRRIVISGDTRPCQATGKLYAAGADVLIHEATFMDDERVRARETGHSPPARPPSSPATPASACWR